MQRYARAVTAASVLTSTALVLTSCTGSSGTTSASGTKTLNIATMTLPQSLDPEVATGRAMPFFQAVYDTLIKRNADAATARCWPPPEATTGH